MLRPGASFSVEGYCATAARFGLRLDPDRWREAERRAAAAVAARRGERGDRHYDGVHLTHRRGDRDDHGRARRRASRPPARRPLRGGHRRGRGRPENFALYDDVRPCLARLRANGPAVGLISNTTRDLDELITAFALGDLVDGAVTNAQVGVFKPAPAIFAAALERIDAAAGEAVMVGDSRRDDVEGALAAGLAGAVLLDRDGRSSTPRRTRCGDRFARRTAGGARSGLRAAGLVKGRSPSL